MTVLVAVAGEHHLIIARQVVQQLIFVGNLLRLISVEAYDLKTIGLQEDCMVVLKGTTTRH